MSTQEQSNWDHVVGLITNLQKRVYALERELRERDRQSNKGYPGYD